MKKIMLLQLGSIVALSLQAMEDGQHTPKRLKIKSSFVAHSGFDSDNEELSEKEQKIVYYNGIKKGFSDAIESLRYSPMRDSSIEKISGATKQGALLRSFGVASVVPVVYKHRRIAIQNLGARIAQLNDIAQRAEAFTVESRQVLGVKTAHEMSAFIGRAQKALEKLTELREDMVEGGNSLAEQAQNFAGVKRNPFEAFVDTFAHENTCNRRFALLDDSDSFSL